MRVNFVLKLEFIANLSVLFMSFARNKVRIKYFKKIANLTTLQSFVSKINKNILNFNVNNFSN